MDVASPGETLRANIVTPSVIEHAFLAQLEVLRNAVKASRNFRARQKAMCLAGFYASGRYCFAEGSATQTEGVMKVLPRVVAPDRKTC
jgi:hypothetical protein